MIEYSYKMPNEQNIEDWGFYIDLEEYNPIYPNPIILSQYCNKNNQHSRSINQYTIYEEPINNCIKINFIIQQIIFIILMILTIKLVFY
jgi:hypothetical protein